MAKFKVKLILGSRGIADKIEFGRTVHDAMLLNPLFVTPSPTLLILKGVTDDLEAAFILRAGGAHLAVAQMRATEASFDVVMTALGAYVDNIAQGVEATILSAGMQTRKQPTPIGIPAKVVNLVARPLDVLGTIKLRWKSVYGKRSYNVYVKTDGEPDEEYKLMAQPSKANVTLDGLTSGVYYWFRVEAVGAAGIGAVSDGAKAIAY
jgi:hypothetical protein